MQARGITMTLGHVLTRITVFGLLAISGFPAWATDLNAAVNDKPTVGSEISRGSAAAFDCTLHSGPDTWKLSNCINSTAEADRQRHSTYLPFEAGIYFGGWVHSDLALQSAESLAATNSFAKQVVPVDRGQTQRLFIVFEGLERKLNVTDAQVISAATADMTPAARTHIAERMRYWRSQPPPQPQ